MGFLKMWISAVLVTGVLVLESAEKELGAVAWDSFAGTVHDKFSHANAPTKYEVFSFTGSFLNRTYSTVAAVMDNVESGKKLGITEGEMDVIRYYLIVRNGPEVGEYFDIGQERYTISSKEKGNDYTAQKDGNSLLVRSLDKAAGNILVALCPSAKDSCFKIVDELAYHVYNLSLE